MPEDITQQCRALIVSLGQMMAGEEPLFDSCGDPTIFDEDTDAHPIDSTIKRIIWAIDNDRLPDRQPESAVAAQALREERESRPFFEELQMRLRYGDGVFTLDDLTAIQNVHRRVRSAVEYAFCHAEAAEGLPANFHTAYVPLSVKDVANQIGTSEETVRNRWKDAHDHLTGERICIVIEKQHYWYAPWLTQHTKKLSQNP
jgi:hypothetical protein